MPDLLSADEIAEITDERDRYRAALDKIAARWLRNHEGWRARTATDHPGTNWSDGFHTALATVREEAVAALNPDAHRAGRAQQSAVNGTDREWFDLTGNCGGCGNVANRCNCPPSAPCACGPHELEPWPRQCGTCQGTGELPKPAWWDAEGRP